MNEKIKALATKEEINTLATKAELKAEQDKIVKLETHDLSYFVGENFFRGDGFQNMFVYQLTFFTLELKVNKNTEYVVGWKSKGLYKSNLFPLYCALLPNIKYLMPKIAIQSNNTSLVVEQSNYATKIINAYIVYNLDN